MFGKSGKQLRNKRFDSWKTDFEREGLFSQGVGMGRKLPQESKEPIYLPGLWFGWKLYIFFHSLLTLRSPYAISYPSGDLRFGNK